MIERVVLGWSGPDRAATGDAPCRIATKAEGRSLAAPHGKFEMDTEEIRHRPRRQPLAALDARSPPRRHREVRRPSSPECPETPNIIRSVISMCCAQCPVFVPESAVTIASRGMILLNSCTTTSGFIGVSLRLPCRARTFPRTSGRYAGRACRLVVRVSCGNRPPSHIQPDSADRCAVDRCRFAPRALGQVIATVEGSLIFRPNRCVCVASLLSRSTQNAKGTTCAAPLV
jgi:hypothetical protein